MSDYHDLVQTLEYRWGLHEPHFPVPVPLSMTPQYAFTVEYAFQLIREFFEGSK